MIRCLLLFLLALPAMAAEPPPLAAPFAELPASPALIGQLRGGGFVLYMRHGATDTTRPDMTPQVDLADCSTQRPLTEEGRATATRIGAAIHRLRIPVGDVLSSPLCRAKESAQAAFGRFEVENQLMYTANMTSAEKLPVIAVTRALLSRPVPAGSNRVLVAHAPNLMDVMGYFPKVEGTVVIFRPAGERGFDYLASITPAQWVDLLSAAR